MYCVYTPFRSFNLVAQREFLGHAFVHGTWREQNFLCVQYFSTDTTTSQPASHPSPTTIAAHFATPSLIHQSRWEMNKLICHNPHLYSVSFCSIVILCLLMIIIMLRWLINAQQQHQNAFTYFRKHFLVANSWSVGCSSSNSNRSYVRKFSHHLTRIWFAYHSLICECERTQAFNHLVRVCNMNRMPQEDRRKQKTKLTPWSKFFEKLP